tara:strand:- start:958 stop:1587 length:630 start_codon:yes stop_codon:yes gene_type:complete
MEKEKTEDQINSNSNDNNKLDESVEQTKKAEGEKIEEISNEDKILELEEKIVRQYAEMENQRRRYEKERDDAFEYGGFSLAKETLNLIDNLERSKITIESDESIKNSEASKKIIDHLEIIFKDMMSILKKNNIYPIEALGKKMDPNLHQAMMEIEDESKENGIIVQEIQRGFMMKDRLLRPSLVGVAKKTVKKDDNLSENKEKETKKSE